MITFGFPAEDTLRVEVADSDPAAPAVVPVDTEADAGRGLHIVAALALRWGVEPSEPNGKTVWFEVAARAA